MSIADRFLLDMEYDEGLAPVPETNMNAWMEDPRPGPNLHANPDKAVIQARGRRRIPQTFSPDRVASNQVEQETDNIMYCDIVSHSQDQGSLGSVPQGQGDI